MGVLKFAIEYEMMRSLLSIEACRTFYLTGKSEENDEGNKLEISMLTCP